MQRAAMHTVLRRGRLMLFTQVHHARVGETSRAVADGSL